MTVDTKRVSVKLRGGTGLLVAAVAASLLSSCSFTMRRLPSDWEPHQRPRCTESAIRPMIDTAAAVPLTLFGPAQGVASLTSSCEGEECFGAAVGVLLSIPFTLLDIAYVSSAVYGYRAVNRCSKAHMAYQRTLHPETVESPTGVKPAGSEDTGSGGPRWY